MKSNRNAIICSLFFTLCALGASAQHLIPLPKQVEMKEGYFAISSRTSLYDGGMGDLATYLNDHIERANGYRLTVALTAKEEGYENTASGISLHLNPALGVDAYQLSITSEGIDLTGGDRGGVFYAIQTLLQLMPSRVYGDQIPSDSTITRLPCMEIEDAPRYAYRGAMLDVSRTFFDKATVLRYLDWMSRHKMNRFHWHLTDDDGWRIEIKKYPELTSRGAWRGPGEALPRSYSSGNTRYGGYFTQEDVKEIVRYASFRNIEIIPEIDLPGHSRAITATHPETFCELKEGTDLNENDMRSVLCVSREENYTMLRDIMTELATLFPSPYIHIGGDEVSSRYWKNCENCQALMTKKSIKDEKQLLYYFVNRMEGIVDSLGKKSAAWNEVLKADKLMPGTMIYGWENLGACEAAARAGHPVVMMPGTYCYIDMKQGPFEMGHTWAGMVDTRRVYSFDPSIAALTAEQQKQVMGVEAALFAELLQGDGLMEYQAYPRLCAMAEVGWSDPSKRNWDDFYTRLTTTHMDRLATMGIGFRLYPPTALYGNHRITVSHPNAQAEVRYTSDGTEPTRESRLYTTPIEAEQPERYLFRAFYRSGISPAIPAVSLNKQVSLTPDLKQSSITIPISEYVDYPGIWLLSVMGTEDETRIDQLEITGADTSYYVIKNGQTVNPLRDIRLYIDEKNITAKLIVTLSNNTPRENAVTLTLRPSPYIEPPVRVTSSLTFAKRFPATNAMDYNRSSYARTTESCKRGDYILYTFDDPVECQSIEVMTGLPDLPRYTIPFGKVSYSQDGTQFVPCGELDARGVLTIYPSSAVKAIRIQAQESNGETIVSILDLKVTPKPR